MADLVNGAYFERVQVLFNNQIAIDSASVIKVTTSGDQQVSAVPGMSANHLTPGFIRGNAMYTANLNIAQTYNTPTPDFVNIDYDTTVVTMALYAPTSNYGTSNVYAGSKKYYLLTGMFLSNNDELNASGVGQIVTGDYIFKCVNASWVYNQ